ncbi:unnamed protein product [Pleuronectes platessa]|uniref:Uncharacterized protein n=1 Tax=Pleuronectes platessa TaxID=8262 RepID=A0A9N7UJY0_PLEPL|nr:unnamed protein product [Pleuronectes platessa]
MNQCHKVKSWSLIVGIEEGAELQGMLCLRSTGHSLLAGDPVVDPEPTGGTTYPSWHRNALDPPGRAGKHGWGEGCKEHPYLDDYLHDPSQYKCKGQCMLLRFDGHGQIGPPSPTWNALSVPLRGSSESFSCRAHFSNYTSK